MSRTFPLLPCAAAFLVLNFATTTLGNPHGGLANLPRGHVLIAGGGGGFIPKANESYRNDKTENSIAGNQEAMHFVAVPRVFYYLVEYLRVGSFGYVLVFGLMLIVANFFVAPRPAAGVTVVGWGLVAFSVVLAWAKLDWEFSLVLTIMGLMLGGVVHHFGRKAAVRRVGRLDEEQRDQELSRERERKEFQSLVGSVGTALTDLKACGSVMLHGEMMTGRAMRGYIPQDAEIIVRSIEGHTLVVERR